MNCVVDFSEWFFMCTISGIPLGIIIGVVIGVLYVKFNSNDVEKDPKHANGD